MAQQGRMGVDKCTNVALTVTPSRQSDIDMQTWRALEDPVIPADGKNQLAQVLTQHLGSIQHRKS